MKREVSPGPHILGLKVVPPLVTDASALLLQCLWSLHHTLCIHTLRASYVSRTYRCDPADRQLLETEDASQGAKAALPWTSLLSVFAEPLPRTKQATRYFTQVTLLPFLLLELNIFSYKKVREQSHMPLSLCLPRLVWRARREFRGCFINTLAPCQLGGKKDDFLAKPAIYSGSQRH